MVRAWRAAFGSDPTTEREAIDLALREAPLREAIEAAARDRSGQLDALSLGKWLQRHADRIAERMEFKRAGECKGSATWKICEGGEEFSGSVSKPHARNAKEQDG